MEGNKLVPVEVSVSMETQSSRIAAGPSLARVIGLAFLVGIIGSMQGCMCGHCDHEKFLFITAGAMAGGFWAGHRSTEKAYLYRVAIGWLIGAFLALFVDVFLAPAVLVAPALALISARAGYHFRVEKKRLELLWLFLAAIAICGFLYFSRDIFEAMPKSWQQYWLRAALK